MRKGRETQSHRSENKDFLYLEEKRNFCNRNKNL